MGKEIGRKCEKKDEGLRQLTVSLTEAEYALVEEYVAASYLSSVNEGATQMFSIACRVIENCAQRYETAHGTRYPTFS
jgi:hypothetical protein